MVYDKVIQGKFVSLRSITLDDAEFSYNLRKDPRFVEIMGQSAPSSEAQREYIKNQREKEGDYYFVVENRAGERIGLIGVYDIQGDRCEIGRELNIGAAYETMEASILISEFALNDLHLKTSVSCIYKNNSKQLKKQRQLGIEPIREIMRSGIPAYEYETPIIDVLKRLEKAKNLINQLSESRGN